MRTALAAAALAAGLLAAHPDAKSEWWYVTGHLRSAAGGSYGFELTFFRIRVADGGDLDAAHFALTDVGARKFSYSEKLHRPFPGIAGTDAGRFFVFNENWDARAMGDRIRLRATMPEASIDLELTPEKPAVFNGAGGISRKGPGPDDYSRYATIPRLSVSGELRRKGGAERVSGLAWLDHEWGPGTLPADLAGWDWFSVQMSDGSDLMLYRLRLQGGAASPFSSGTFFAPDGRVERLDSSDFEVVPTGVWHSPRSGATYPSGWRLKVPRLAIDLSIVPALRDQELDTSRSTRVTYWEGACEATGSRAGRPVAGRSYVELTGYAKKDLP